MGMREAMRVKLKAVPSSVQLARSLVASVLDERDDITPECRHAALVAVSEITSNAIAHASQTGDEIELRASLEGRRLTAAIVDPARAATVPELRTPQEELTAGRGLLIVDRLVDSWQDRIVDGCREVSFVLSV